MKAKQTIPPLLLFILSIRLRVAPMSPSNDLGKRQISKNPHAASYFANGEFVYDPDADWEALQTGNVVCRNNTWRICFSPRSTRVAIDEELESYTGRLGRHVLVNNSGLGPARGPALDPRPWQRIATATIAMLRGSDNYRISLDQLLNALVAKKDLDADLVGDTLRMMVSMGTTTVSIVSGKPLYCASELVVQGLARKKYLATFSDELLAKSRRIDHLIGHTGTVGTYREELLRGTLQQLLPTQFQASTGFIESCPRQLDIIIWDAARYSPLFRENEVVVVPSAAVRGIIEVKTTLSTQPLDEALEILHDVLRTEQQVIPVFKGIFAFESGYKSDLSVAERIRDFHVGNQEDGLSRKHWYLFQGVTAVCVPHSIFVFQRYSSDSAQPESFPRPMLFGLEHDWPGDLRTAAFLSELLAHLDLDPAAKQTQREMFGPVFTEVGPVKLVDLFGIGWQPQIARGPLGKTLKPAVAREYVSRVYHFMAGGISASELSQGLQNEPNEPGRS